MPRTSLTQTFVDRDAKPVHGLGVDHFDDRTTGLALRVTGPSKHHEHGLRTWRWIYRFDGKQRVITIGHAPPWSAKAAHAFAREAQVLLDKKQDPAAVLRPRPVNMLAAKTVLPAAIDSVKAMVARYEVELSKKSATHYRNAYAYFNRFILPQWGDRDVNTITRRDIVDLLNAIAAKGHAVSANRCATVITSWFNFLIDQGITTSSPATNLPKTKERERARVLDLSELVLVWKAADMLGGPAGRFVQLMTATATRRDEAAKLPRHELGAEGWLLPEARNKGRRDFMIPLSPLALAVLDQCPNTGKYVFSTSGVRPLSGFSAIKRKMDANIIELQGKGGRPLEPWTFHDVRRSIATALGKLKVAPFVVERVLNHALPKLERTYNHHDYYEEKAKALTLWSDHFGPLVDPHYNVAALDAAAD